MAEIAIPGDLSTQEQGAFAIGAADAEASLADIPSSGLVYDVATGRIEIVA